MSRIGFVPGAGEFVALVGKTGSGKSSVFRLLQRAYLPDAGDIVIDGRDVGAYDPSWLKQRLCMIPETPVLFSKSIKDNILIGVNPSEGSEVGHNTQSTLEKINYCD